MNEALQYEYEITKEYFYNLISKKYGEFFAYRVIEKWYKPTPKMKKELETLWIKASSMMVTYMSNGGYRVFE